MKHKHIYCIGIGGAGMTWIVDYALVQGWQVSGSELAQTAVTEAMQDQGVHIHYVVDPAQIPEGITEAVVTSAITESAPSYPELQELERRSIPIQKRAQWVGAVTKRHCTIAVAGTHGKSTTTAMVGWILEKAGLDPTVFVGGKLVAWQNRTRIGKSKYLVVEADEFDRSFHNFYAKIIILLNIDADHLDYYTGGINEIEQSFRRFLRNMPVKEGIVVGYGRDRLIRKICRGFAYRFRWYDEQHMWPGLKLVIPGEHNRLNATAAARVAHELGIKQEIIKEALASFPGVGRRFEYVGKWQKAEIFDDYAHHPREIAATLQAAAQRFKDQPLTVVFQPHQKARTHNLLPEFGRCFDLHPPHKLILAPIYQVAGREEAIEVESRDIALEIAKKTLKGMEVKVAATNQELEELVRQAVERPGIVLVMGAGSIRQLTEGWMA